MDLNRKIEANDQGFFVVTFFNERDREKNLTETTLKYVFSKFGQVSDIKFTEHGRVFISYKEKEGAFKALEVMNMGTKYRVETDWQPVKKNETVQSTLFKQDMSFQNKKTNSNNKNQQIPTVWHNGKFLTSNFNQAFFNFESIYGEDADSVYKTKLCTNFNRGFFNYSVYKTKLCQNYWSVGYCAYGPHCRFIHYEVTNEELEMTNNHQFSDLNPNAKPFQIMKNDGLNPNAKPFQKNEHFKGECEKFSTVGEK